MPAQRTGVRIGSRAIHRGVVDSGGVLCGRVAFNASYTFKDTQVTCKRCLKVLREAKK